MVSVRSHTVVNIQPDGAIALLFLPAQRLRRRFERPKFEQSGGVARGGNFLNHLGGVLHPLVKSS
jgi:hypothetical protein